MYVYIHGPTLLPPTIDWQGQIGKSCNTAKYMYNAKLHSTKE